MIGFLRTVHAWAGAILALILIVLGLTGALLVFKADFVRLTVPEARETAAASPRVLGEAAEALEHTLHGELRYVVFADQRLGVHQAVYTQDRYAYANRAGEVIAAWRGRGRPEAFVYELHHFLLAGDRGMQVVGWSGNIAAALALVGLIIWLPVWKTFSLRLWPRGARRGELLPTHRNVGVLFALPVMLFCLTGSGLIFYQTAESFIVRLAPGPAPEEFFPPSDPGDVDWPAAISAAQARFPEAQVRVAFWPSGARSPARIQLRQPEEWRPDGRTQVLIDPATSQVRGVIDPQALGWGYRLNDALYPIHTAAVGGRLYDAVTFLTGLALAALGGFGLWSFLLKPRRRRSRPSSAS